MKINIRRSTIAVLVCMALILGGIAGVAARAQNPNPAPPAPSSPALEFEVASVKLSLSPSTDKNDPFLLPFGNQQPASGLFSKNAPVLMFILFAYDIRDPDQIQSLLAHLPDWARTSVYDIEARADGIPTRDQVRQMMQSLLKDRFKLALHYETHPGAVNALVVDKPGMPGPKLRVHPENAPCQSRPDRPDFSGSSKDRPLYCGLDSWRENGKLHLRLTDATMEQVASLLNAAGAMVGSRDARPIVDKTGLQERYDAEIEFVTESNGPGSGDSQEGSGGPTFTAALRDQLGLKLVKDTGPVQVLAIDHIEKPSSDE